MIWYRNILIFFNSLQKIPFPFDLFRLFFLFIWLFFVSFFRSLTFSVTRGIINLHICLVDDILWTKYLCVCLYFRLLLPVYIKYSIDLFGFSDIYRLFTGAAKSVPTEWGPNSLYWNKTFDVLLIKFWSRVDICNCWSSYWPVFDRDISNSTYNLHFNCLVWGDMVSQYVYVNTNQTKLHFFSKPSVRVDIDKFRQV